MRQGHIIFRIGHGRNLEFLPEWRPERPTLIDFQPPRVLLHAQRHMGPPSLSSVSDRTRHLYPAYHRIREQRKFEKSDFKIKPAPTGIRTRVEREPATIVGFVVGQCRNLLSYPLPVSWLMMEVGDTLSTVMTFCYNYQNCK